MILRRPDVLKVVDFSLFSDVPRSFVGYHAKKESLFFGLTDFDE